MVGNLKNTLDIFSMEALSSPVKLPSMPSNGGKVNMPMKAKKFSTEMRTKLAKKGYAKSDGSYPIKTTTDVGNAVKDYYRSHGSPSDKAHIQENAKRLGMSDPFAKKKKVEAAKCCKGCGVDMKGKKGSYCKTCMEK